jgi:hypothetical protein
MGPPTDLVLQLKERFSIKNFIETGTYLGGTSSWAASHFEQVITIENSRTIYSQTVAKYRHVPNIEFLFGHSKELLKSVVPALDGPAIFWLDGHWCGGESYGEDDPCPLLDEIETLNTVLVDHFLLIDDARLFTSPPPRPHRIDEWPSIDHIIESLKAGRHERYIVIFEDVMIAVPHHARDFVAHWCQDAVSQSSKAERGSQKNSGRLGQGIGLINQGLHLLAEGALSKVRLAKNG